MQAFKTYIKILLVLVLACSAPVTVLSQESEQELKETADKLFADEKYVEAKPYVERLLALQPRSTDYQFKYGTCLLYNGYKKTDAFKYLQYSVTDPQINVSAYYFLGKAYHLTYQFNEAIRNYNLYKQKAANAINPKFEVDRQIEMCQNGKNLLSGLTEIVVLEKKEYSASEFFRIYDLRNIGGEILVAANFQSKIDKKKNYTPLIHFPKNTSTVYYASYGETDKGNKDIYCRKKLPDGSWGIPQLVAGSVNTSSDEDYPYMHPGGDYLYFSSKGHNSMGGYDIFRAKLDKNNGTFGEVENIDFAISSADNDLFYVVDSLDQNACFASTRQSNNGKIYVYKVKVSRQPLQLAVIKGDFASTINPENKKISITVKDAKTNESVGIFVSDSKGKYLITLPKSGNYIYEMKVDGSTLVHKYQFNVPYNKEFTPLKQHISQELSESKEIVKVDDRFNESFDDPSAILAEIIQQKSELNVNYQNFSEEQLSGTSNSTVLASLGLKNSSPQEKAEKIDLIAKAQEDKAKEAQKMVDGARVKAMTALNEADKKQAMAKTLVAKSANETDQEKFKLLKEAQALMTQANELKSEANTFVKFSDSIAPKVVQEEQKSKELKTLSEAVALAAQNNDDKQIETLVEEKAAAIKSANESDKSTVIQPLVDKKKAIVQKENKAEQDLSAFKATEKSIAAEIEQLKKDLAEAKTKEKPAIESKISSKESELNMTKEEIGIQSKKLDELKSQEKVVGAELTFLQEVNNANYQNPPAADAVRQRQLEVDSKNVRSMNDYIDQQVGILEKSETIAEIKDDPTATETAAIIEQEWSAIQKQIDAAKTEEKSLDEANNLTPKEVAQLKIDNDQKTLTEVSEAKTKLNEVLAKNPANQELKDKIAELNKVESETQQHLDQQKEIIKNTAGTTVVSTIASTPEQEIKTIYPSYSEEKKVIKESNPENQLEALNGLDKKLLAKTEQELTAVTAELEKTPNAASLIDRKKALTELKTQMEGNISSRNKAIEAMKGSNTVTTTVTPESVLNQVDPSYNEKQAQVSSPDKRTELEARNEIDQELLFSINTEKKKVEDALRTQPQNTGLKAKKDALVSLETKTKAAIAKRNEEIKTLPEVETVETTSPKEQLANIDPDYELKVSRIDKSTRENELKGLVELNEGLVTTLKDELGQVNEVLAGQPENQSLKNKKVALETLLTEKEAEISKDKEEIESLKPVETTTTDATAELKKALRPTYEENIAKIDGSDSSEEEKVIAKTKEEEALLKAINDKIAANDKVLAKSPDNSQLLEENTQLKEIQAVQEAKLEEQHDNAVAIERAKINPVEFQKTIAPKFVIPSSSALQTQNPATQKELAAQEQELRANLVEQLRKNEKAVQKEFDPKLVAENRVINVLMEQSVERENKIGEQSKEPNAKDLLVQSATPEQQESLSVRPATLAQSQEFKAVLEELQTNIMKDADSPSFTPEERNTKRVQAVIIQQRISELNAIEKTFETTSATVVETTDPKDTVGTTDPENTTQPTNTTAENNVVEELNTKEKELQAQLASTTSKPEKKQLEKELKTVQENKAKAIDSVNVAQVNELKSTKTELVNSLPANEAITTVAKERTTSSSTSVTPLNKEEQVIAEQKSIALLEAVKTSSETQNTFEKEGVVISTPQELAKSKRRLQIEIGELEREIAALGTTPQEVERKTVLQKQVTVLEDEIAKIEKLEAASKTEEVTNPLLAEGLKTSVTPEKEMEIRSNPSYQEALVVQQELAKVQQQERGITKEIEGTRLKFEEPNVDKAQLVEELKTLQQEQQELKKEAAAIEAKLRTITESKGADADQWKNVVSRELPVVKPQASNEELAPFVADGFKITQPTDAVKSTVLNKDLPIGIKLPSGLVYRVQVGAFAKPVPEELFKEFTPVTGEKLNNGITRYMAGFFGDRQKVLDAQKQIRAIGYGDAFVVAYCDGERITLAEARRLEDAGLCVPKDQNEIAIEVTQNVIAQLPQDSLKPSVKEIKPGDYNKAEGAAPAIAVEERLGLFYTVQVGVYNKPVPSSQLKDIDPLVTKRLENGQIRYSSGVFHSVGSAVPKKKEAIALGISDAFITAYYKGERISLDEAKRILKEQGESALEPLETPVSVAKVDEIVAQSIESERVEPKTAKQGKAELVSTQTYTTYPAKEIQALNTVGTFYYDSVAQKIKSVTYSSDLALPSVASSAVSFDTLHIGKVENAIQNQSELVEIIINDEMDGALANYLIRGNVPFESFIAPETNASKIRIFASKTTNFAVILNQLEVLGVAYVARNAFDDGE